MIINRGNLQTVSRGFSAAFREGFGQAPVENLDVLAMESTSRSKEEEYGWLGQFPSLREWVGERVRRGIMEHGYTIRNKKYEAAISVGRDDIEDDHYGVYSPIMREAGRAAAAHPLQLVFQALKNGFTTVCYDGQYFFDSDHDDGKGGSHSNTGGGSGATWCLLDCSRMIRPFIFQRRRDYALRMVTRLDDSRVFETDEFEYGVDGRCNVGYGLWQLAYGSKQPLTAAAYEAARRQMHEVTGDQGRPLEIMPTHLVVPPSLEGDALELLNAERNAQGATNVWRNTAKLVMTPWLA